MPLLSQGDVMFSDQHMQLDKLMMPCRRKVNISKFTGKATVNIREYYEVGLLVSVPCNLCSVLSCRTNSAGMVHFGNCIAKEHVLYSQHCQMVQVCIAIAQELSTMSLGGFH